MNTENGVRLAVAEPAGEPFAGGVTLAPGLTESQVKAIVEAFKDVYSTEEGFQFFEQFYQDSTNATLILTAGNLNKQNSGTGDVLWGKTTSSGAELGGHLTVTITIDVAVIQKYQDSKPSPGQTSLGGIDYSKVKT